jgi:hypothetical protein
MTKVQNLDHAALVIDPVVNQKRAVEQFPYLWPPADDAAHARKAGEQINVVK